MKRFPMREYLVTVGVFKAVRVHARSAGHAARQAFRFLIARSNERPPKKRDFKCQPKTDIETGGWVGTSIRLVAPSMREVSQ